MSRLSRLLIRGAAALLSRTLYKIRVAGKDHVPNGGPAVLISNHVSYLDAVLIGACLSRRARVVLWQPYHDPEGLKWVRKLFRVIPAEAAGGGNREQAQEALRRGHVVLLFAECAITRTGNLLPFQRGFEGLASEANAPVIPVYVSGTRGMLLSFERGRMRKRPRLRQSVTVSFGRPLPPAAAAFEIRQALLALGSEASLLGRGARDLLHLRFIASAKRRWFTLCMADSGGKELTYGRALTAGLLLARWLRRFRPDDRMIGLLLPASVGGALANVAVLLAGRIPVNLNFTAGQEAVSSAVRQCGIRTVLTSRLFLSKLDFRETDGMVFLEDVTARIGGVQKALAAIAAFLAPSRLLQALSNAGGKSAGDLATIVFSSGSTGTPKGVMLSHRNIVSNIESLATIFWMEDKDRVMGVLPFFHVFGFTCTLWYPLVNGFGVIYHPNPMDAKTIGELVLRYRASLLMSTPTFYANYIRRCSREDFASLRYAIVGAEKLPAAIAQGFREKFGMDLLEGYGVTEMSPVIAVNVPDVIHGGQRQTGHKPGTVGHPIPGAAIRVVDPSTLEPLGPGQEGLVLVDGPGRMMGYFLEPEKTVEALRGGWYVTGDIGCVDEDGFLRITDRLSRFSKIGGEMVPHIRLEEAIGQVLEGAPCAVTAVPDEQRGERLVALYASDDVTPAELWQRLNQTGLPKLWIPKRENLYPVEALPPALGSGKMDLGRLRALASERVSRGKPAGET